jgi:hypothetical protein
MDRLRSKRVARAAIGAVIILAGWQAASVAAAATSSAITAPADGTLVIRPREPLPQIEGTAAGMSKVDINCYYGDSANVRQRVATGVSVVGEHFSVKFPYETYEAGNACVLRAVPEEDTGWYPPGDAVPYAGPRITESSEAVATYDPITNPNVITYSFGDVATSFAARTTIRSAGQCALGESLLFSPGELTKSPVTFRCDGGLKTPPHEKAAPTGVTVDGISAFPPGTVYELNNQQPIASAPQVSVTQNFDPGTAEISIDEHEPLAICAARPAQPESCEGWVSAGVELERTWHTSSGNQLALMADTWRSTDGRPHTLAITYELGMGQGPSGGGFQFPGQSSLAHFPAGLSATPPTGPATIFYSEDLGTPPGGDDVHPFTAITYSASPSSYREVEEEFEWGSGEMYYQPALAANGSFSVQMGFSQAFSLEQVHALAAQAELAMRQLATSAGGPGAATSSLPSAPARAHLALLAAKSKGSKVVITVGCTGPAGTYCKLDASLSSREKLRGKRVVAVSAARRRAHWRSVTIAAARRSVRAGGRMTITLSADQTGRRLLARFRRFAVQLTLAELSGARPTVLRRQTLELRRPAASRRPPRRKRR